jgi:hypothetical protein
MSGSRACFRTGTDSNNFKIDGAPRITSADVTIRRADSVKPASPSSPIPRITSLERASLTLGVLTALASFDSLKSSV